MENIYKIKIRSNPDPRGLYPSERRYSASTVLGLGVVHIALAVTALLLASLSLSSARNQISPLINVSNYSNELNEEAINDTNSLESLSNNSQEFADCGEFNPYTNLSLAPCIMSLGALAAGLAGLLAWKRWYIDHNIRWFFFMSLISTITSTVCVIMTTATIVTVYEKIDQLPYDYAQKKPNVRFILALNILIACILELVWSSLSAKVAFRGMRNTYPDDIIISKNRGKIEVNTVHKGNKKTKIVPPDILNHFPTSGKLAKYLPRIDNGNLPKAESNSEYQERVRQFLSSHTEGESIK